MNNIRNMNIPLLKKISKAARPTTSKNGAVGGTANNPTEPTNSQETTSAYFSPKRTRARAQIKIEYEKSDKIVSSGRTDIKNVRLAVLGKRSKEAAKTLSSSSCYSVTIKTEPTDLEAKPILNIKTEPIYFDPNLCKLDCKSETTLVKFKTEDDRSESVACPTEADSSPKQLKWEPPKWKETLANIQLMRHTYKAAVDTMGCHMCYDPDADEKTKRFHILVALMLSSQTKDEVTYDAMMRLKANVLTPKQIVSTDQSDLEQIIYPVSFYKNKAKFLKKTAQILIDDYDSDIPSTFSGLIKLPGVGPKMGHICMSAAWKIVSGIGVDTHVHRITNRLKWTQKSTADPEHTRIALEQWLPLDMWADINPLLVGFGQTICTPLNPKCGKCANASICPSRGVKK